MSVSTNNILIYVDRCYDIQEFHPLYSAANSCIYEIRHLVHRICVGEARGKLCDYMQLGWLALSIAMNTIEHGRIKSVKFKVVNLYVH